MSKTSSAVKNRYNRKTYKAVQTMLKKELVEEWEAELVKDGITKAEFIRQAIESYLGSKKGER